MENLYSLTGLNPAEETILPLLSRDGVRVEKILSSGQASPDGFWYDQSEHEWVCVLSGGGEIAYPDGSRAVLRRGDSLFLPAHCRHRVSRAENPCVWLCVFWKPQDETARARQEEV